jgi:hypothetical protein
MSSLVSFFTDETPVWGTLLEREVRRRIVLSVAAYSYEYEDESIMSDADFDKMSLEVRPKMKTGNDKMDRFFKNNFDPSTGQWIRKHPRIDRIKQIYNDYYKR